MIDIKKTMQKAGAGVLGLALAATCAVPALAYAADNPTPGPQSTDVTIQSKSSIDGGTQGGQTSSDENLTFTTPTVIPFAAAADGTMAGPSADSVQIKNLSAFPIHVTNVAVAEQSPFHLVADVSQSTGDNDFQFTINGTKAAASADTSADEAWNMGYAGSATDKLSLATTDAKIARVTADLSTAQKAATVTWTVAPGAAK